MRPPRVAATLLALLFAGLAAAAAAQPSAFVERGTVRASEILGRQVDSPQGARLGAIRDLLVNRASRKVQFLALERGAYPVDELRSGDGLQLVLQAHDDNASAGAGAASAGLMRLSELLGRPVTDRAGRPLGRVLDVTVDVLDGTLAYLVVDGGDGSGRLRVPAADVLVP